MDCENEKNFTTCFKLKCFILEKILLLTCCMKRRNSRQDPFKIPCCQCLFDEEFSDKYQMLQEACEDLKEWLSLRRLMND